MADMSSRGNASKLIRRVASAHLMLRDLMPWDSSLARASYGRASKAPPQVLCLFAAVVPLCGCGAAVGNSATDSTGGTANLGGGGTDGSSSVGGGGTDSECRVTITSEEGATQSESYVYRYDPSARRLISAVYTYDLDDELRAYKVYGNRDENERPTLFWTDEYDEHGNIVRNEHYSAGIRTYINSYEDTRLVLVEASGQGADATRTTYAYGDESVPDAWTRQVTDSGSGVARTFVDGKVSTVAFFEESGTVFHSWQYVYDAVGRIQATERDGGLWKSDVPDGTPNILYEWQRDSAGTVTTFTGDGTDANDNPFLNGISDYIQTYSPGCRTLLEKFPWLAHEPGPNSTGPRFRTDRW